MQNSNKKLPFTPKEMETVIQSSEARELLHILNKDSGAGIAQATAALKNGDYGKAVSCLKPLLDAPNAEVLLQTLNKKLGQS